MDSLDRDIIAEKRPVSSTTVFSYPKEKVIESYFLFGGAIGGSLLALSIIVDTIFARFSLETLNPFTSVFTIAIFAGMGFILGLPPSLVTALILCRIKIYFDSFSKVLTIFIIGFISTSIFAIWPIYFDHSENKILSFLLLNSVGGLSAIITGLIALPKHR